MELKELVLLKILQPESDELAYEAVLPPSKVIAQIICSFANTDGGLLILGVSNINGLKVSGLSEDFRATSITHKAIDLLTPKPIVDYGYVEHSGKKLYAIRVQKSDTTIAVEGKIFVRRSKKIVQSNSPNFTFQNGTYSRVIDVNSKLESFKVKATDSKLKVVDHYQSVLKMIDGLQTLLYPEGPTAFTMVKEGKILSRIIYSSIVDNFETYLADILFEIYLAKPETLKSSDQLVKVEDVLNCSDIQEFISFWAKQKIGKLQKGSVKGFISENKQIKDLNVIGKNDEEEIEKTLQIRHLYSHRNGIIDDKFLKFFPTGYVYGEEHQLTIEDTLKRLEYLSEIFNRIDSSAIMKYNLSTVY